MFKGKYTSVVLTVATHLFALASPAIADLALISKPAPPDYGDVFQHISSPSSEGSIDPEDLHPGIQTPQQLLNSCQAQLRAGGSVGGVTIGGHGIWNGTGVAGMLGIYKDKDGFLRKYPEEPLFSEIMDCIRDLAGPSGKVYVASCSGTKEAAQSLAEEVGLPVVYSPGLCYATPENYMNGDEGKIEVKPRLRNLD
jgi:hypothetical protein